MGFYNEDRLVSHIENDKDNWSSKGIYDNKDITFSTIRDSTLFIVNENGKEIERHQYNPVFRKPVEHKKKSGKIIITIRKSTFTNEWQILTEKDLFRFDTKNELEIYLLEHFKDEIGI
ncbi:hypothetical protein ACXYMX_16975 [Sporosarcina sp. CAU 1771]